jgi:2-alkyl-3-oxoalkanoate reductase
VIGSARSAEKTERLQALGAQPVVLDLLDREAVREAVAAARPEAIVHQATALAGLTDFKNFDRSFAQTNRLRTEGTDALIAAAREAGVGRFVAQSYAGWPYAREGGPIKTEEDPLDPTPVATMRETLAAIRQLERAVVDAGGVALRYGSFYGSPESAAAASGRSSISRTPLPRPSARSSSVRQGSTTSSTTSLRRCGSGCPRSRRPSARSRPATSHAGSPGSWRANLASC